MREHGAVKWFDSAKGYGFIRRESGGPDAFVYFEAIGDSPRVLDAGEAVEFTVQQGPRGPRAVDVVRIAVQP